jgi:hypothetical protein
MSEAARDFKGDVRKFVTAIIRKYEGAHQKVSRMEEAKDAIQVCARACICLFAFSFVLFLLEDWRQKQFEAVEIRFLDRVFCVALSLLSKSHNICWILVYISLFLVYVHTGQGQRPSRRGQIRGDDTQRGHRRIATPIGHASRQCEAVADGSRKDDQVRGMRSRSIMLSLNLNVGHVVFVCISVSEN